MSKIRKIKTRIIFTADGMGIPVNIHAIGTKKRPASIKDIERFIKKLK